jgi:hypothetical protein
MHGASREDLPRAPQILSAALIRVLPDGFLLKTIFFTVWEHAYTPPPQLSRLATTLTLCHMFYHAMITCTCVAFPVCLKDNLRSCPKQNSSDQIKMV